MRLERRLAPLAGLLLLLAATGCRYYSFTGATIPERLSTLAVPLVEDNSLSTIPNLDEQLTQLLISRFVGQTRLTLVTAEGEADAVLLSRITRYTNQPTSVSGEERATRNRVNISVSVQYLDQTTDETMLERTFSSFEEYDPVEDGLDGEEQAAQAALQNIADDIFTAATSNW